MKKLGIISLVISVGSFLIAINDVFPGHEELLKVVSYLFLGIVLGIIISSLTKNEITFKQFTSSQIFVYFYYGFLGFIFLILLVLLIITEDKEKINIFNGWLSSIGTFTVLSILFGWANIFSNDNKLTIDEKLILAEKFYRDRNFSSSLYYYKSIRDSLDEDDIRIEQIDKKIELVKTQQLNPGIQDLKNEDTG